MKVARVPAETARKNLALVWFCWSASLVLLVLMQTVLGRYGDRAQEAWEWLLPTITPVTLLIAGAVTADAFRDEIDPRSVDRFAFMVARGLSVFYLFAVTATILAAPLTSVPPLRLMNMSNMWLGPLQGIAAASIGVFFVAHASVGRAKASETSCERRGTTGEQGVGARATGEETPK